jgi:hypothetical protein
MANGITPFSHNLYPPLVNLFRRSPLVCLLNCLGCQKLDDKPQRNWREKLSLQTMPRTTIEYLATCFVVYALNASTFAELSRLRQR